MAPSHSAPQQDGRQTKHQLPPFGAHDIPRSPAPSRYQPRLPLDTLHNLLYHHHFRTRIPKQRIHDNTSATFMEKLLNTQVVQSPKNCSDNCTTSCGEHCKIVKILGEMSCGGGLFQALFLSPATLPLTRSSPFLHLFQTFDSSVPLSGRD